VYHKKLSPVEAGVDCIMQHLDSSKCRLHVYINELANQVIMVAGDVKDSRPMLGLSKELAYHIHVLLRKIKTAFSEAPQIHDVAHQIDEIGIPSAEKGGKLFDPAGPCAQVQVRNEEAAGMSGGRLLHKLQGSKQLLGQRSDVVGFVFQMGSLRQIHSGSARSKSMIQRQKPGR
jgi:hypothetical protein